MERPILKKRRLSPIWLLPLLALCLGGWLIYKGLMDRPVKIIVHFKSAQGITPGKTKVIYKGIPVGVVRKITVDKGLDTVSVHIDMVPEAEKSLVEGLQFWIVRPKLSAGQVSGLETILSGAYIAVQKTGRSKVPCREFWGLEEPPPIPESAPGLHIYLRTKDLHSLQRGSPIYYRDIQVGSVQGYRLEENGNIIIQAYIEPPYKHLVHKGSRFWNASGITLAGGLKGMRLRIESLASLIRGGISFDTPEDLRASPLAENGDVFILYEDFSAAEYGILVSLKLENGEDITEGATKVTFQGLEIGRVRKLLFNPDDPKYKVTALLLLDPSVKSLLRQGTKFWIIRPRVSAGGVRNLETLVSGPYITLTPGAGPPCFEFVAQGVNSKRILKGGVRYKLRAKDLSSIQPGTPVVFKHIQVGEVESYRLAKDDHVELTIIIYDDFASLVKTKCVFWNYSGLNVELTPTSLKLSADTIQSILSGGITFALPPTYKNQALKPAPPGHTFTLYESYEEALKAHPELKPDGYFVRLEADFPVSLSEGSPIFYKKIQVGEIVSIDLVPKKDKIVLSGFIKKKYAPLIRQDSRFYVESGISLEGSLRTGFKVKTAPLSSMFMGGVSFVNSPQAPDVVTPPEKWPTFKLFEDKESALGIKYASIKIHFPQIEPLALRAKVKHRGVEIGHVTHVEYLGDTKGMEVTVKVLENARSLFTRDAKVWIVKPYLSLSRIRNLEAVFTGPYLAVEKGQGPVVSKLEGLSKPPKIPVPITGLHLVLEADSLGSLKVGSPVLYRQIPVGQIVGYELSPDAREVWIHVDIAPEYRPLVREKTKFWNVSGVRVHMGLFSGVNIKTESLETIVGGGVTFATPEEKEMGPPAHDGQHFKLYARPKKEWLRWRPKITWKTLPSSF